eukprot:7586810-Pyramimonas_sp.AAC.1
MPAGQEPTPECECKEQREDGGGHGGQLRPWHARPHKGSDGKEGGARGSLTEHLMRSKRSSRNQAPAA